jgi:predicted ribosome quality control (RQC) complex YloA/Tae2 family protein
MEYTFNKTKFIVGRNAQENWRIISKADKNYYWFHLSDIPSSHVIIEIDVEPTQEELNFALEVCKSQTFRNKESKDVSYICTQVKNLKLGSKPGEVLIK